MGRGGSSSGSVSDFVLRGPSLNLHSVPFDSLLVVVLSSSFDFAKKMNAELSSLGRSNINTKWVKNQGSLLPQVVEDF